MPEAVIGRESEGGSGFGVDGKRFDALDVAVEGRRLLKGGSLREGVGSRFSLMENLSDFLLLVYS